MDKMSLEIPTRIETERLFLRPYQAGDGAWYCAMSQKNKAHLAQFESGNAAMSIQTETDAERVMQDYARCWAAREAFFLGAFRKDTQQFAAQIYIGAANWNLPEFDLGYFADVEHEGQGYVSEAARAALRFCFDHLGAHRVRLECDDTNTRSSRIAQRCGMLLEGHFRENHPRADGSITGTMVYGLLRSEFIGGI